MTRAAARVCGGMEQVQSIVITGITAPRQICRIRTVAREWRGQADFPGRCCGQDGRRSLVAFSLPSPAQPLLPLCTFPSFAQIPLAPLTLTGPCPGARLGLSALSPSGAWRACHIDFLISDPVPPSLAYVTIRATRNAVRIQ